MKLFMVTDRSGWGWSWNVVQAESEEQARALVSAAADVEELVLGETPRVLWCYEDSPDTPRGDYD
jgi:hypothetical protein